MLCLRWSLSRRLLGRLPEGERKYNSNKKKDKKKKKMGDHDIFAKSFKKKLGEPFFLIYLEFAIFFF